VAQVGGGAASQRFNQKFGDTATIRILTPINHSQYDAAQTSLTRRFAKGVMVSANYTLSKNTGICCDDLSDGAPAIQLPSARRKKSTCRAGPYSFGGVSQMGNARSSVESRNSRVTQSTMPYAV
jgi:hypothetical protein